MCVSRAINDEDTEQRKNAKAFTTKSARITRPRTVLPPSHNSRWCTREIELLIPYDVFSGFEGLEDWRGCRSVFTWMGKQERKRRQGRNAQEKDKRNEGKRKRMKQTRKRE